LINILPPDKTVTVAERFSEEFLGLRALQDYRTINLWEVEAEDIFERSLTSLMPFVPILKNGGQEGVVRRAAKALQQNKNLDELQSLLGFFASFVLDTRLVAEILRWDMTVLRESPWYEEILREGKALGTQEGMEEGLQQGLQQGRQQEGVALVLRLLNKRIGSIPLDLQSQIQQLSLSELEALGEALLDFTQIVDLEQWLQSR
jgi:predicted transposase YdaD